MALETLYIDPQKAARQARESELRMARKLADLQTRVKRADDHLATLQIMLPEQYRAIVELAQAALSGK